MADLPTSFQQFFNPSSSWIVFHSLRSYHFYLGMTNCGPDAHLHTMFSFAIPTLLNFLVLKYQNLDKTPFDTRPKTILFGLLNLLLYCLSYGHQQRLYNYMTRPPPSPALVRVLHRCTLFSGYMALACLASLVFPESASPALYGVYAIVSGGDLLYLLYQRIRGSRFQRQGSLLPL